MALANCRSGTGRWWTVTYLRASREVDGDGPLNLLPRGSSPGAAEGSLVG